MIRLLLALLLFVNSTTTPILTFELSEDWGILLINGIEQKPHDFEIVVDNYYFNIQTMPYWTQSSITVAVVDVYEGYLVYSWELYPEAHKEFKYGKFVNKTHNEVTEFDITPSGSVIIPYYEGVNDYDAYFYTGETVGLLEFDLFDPLILYVEVY
jgi:hypothetical protein